jgi:hypothetical protein
VGVVILPTSPWTFYEVKDSDTESVVWLSASVSFTGQWGPTAPLTGGTTFRDPASPYTKVIVGAINPDGSLPVGTKTVTVPLGTKTWTAAQLAAVGLSTIGDVSAAPQVTASP